MILSPLQSTATFTTAWQVVKPVITQNFGNKLYVNGRDYYAQYGLEGHNGTDLRAKEGTPLYAPFDGEIKAFDEGDKDYGQYVKIRSVYGKELTLAHLSKTFITGGIVHMGDLICLSGNSGGSFAPHVHKTYKQIKKGDMNDVWSWKVANYDNGYKGAIDVEDKTITFKGTLLSPNI